MPICTCTIHGDVPEQGSRCSFLVSGMKSVSFNEIKSLFPYVGRYHYRYKHEDFEGFDYVWMDIKGAHCTLLIRLFIYSFTY